MPERASAKYASRGVLHYSDHCTVIGIMVVRPPPTKKRNPGHVRDAISAPSRGMVWETFYPSRRKYRPVYMCAYVCVVRSARPHGVIWGKCGAPLDLHGRMASYGVDESQAGPARSVQFLPVRPVRPASPVRPVRPSRPSRAIGPPTQHVTPHSPLPPVDSSTKTSVASSSGRAGRAPK